MNSDEHYQLDLRQFERSFSDTGVQTTSVVGLQEIRRRRLAPWRVARSSSA